MRKMIIGENYCRKTNSHALKHFEIFERHRRADDVMVDLNAHEAGNGG